MKTETANSVNLNQKTVQDNLRTQQTNKSYTVYTNRSVSKSAQSKLKNFAYTLSRPFRSLIKGQIENSVGIRNARSAMTNINTTESPIRETKRDFTKPPTTSNDTQLPKYRFDYVAISGEGGHRSPTLAERLWG